jgi:mono/diheme cytochrome c family protein
MDLVAFPWSRDMDSQISMDPYEPFGAPPGGSVAAGAVIARAASMEEAHTLANPVAADEASVSRGRNLFGTYCALCHGNDAKGMGSVSPKFIPAPDITSEYYRSLPDGHFYYVMKNGGAVMPSYRESLGEQDIWDIVNHLRELERSATSGR